MKRLLPVLLLLAACQQTNPAKDKAIAALNIPTGGNFVTYVDKVVAAKQAVEEYKASPNLMSAGVARYTRRVNGWGMPTKIKLSEANPYRLPSRVPHVRVLNTLKFLAAG